MPNNAIRFMVFEQMKVRSAATPPPPTQTHAASSSVGPRLALATARSVCAAGVFAAGRFRGAFSVGARPVPGSPAPAPVPATAPLSLGLAPPAVLPAAHTVRHPIRSSPSCRPRKLCPPALTPVRRSTPWAWSAAAAATSRLGSRLGS